MPIHKRHVHESVYRCAVVIRSCLFLSHTRAHTYIHRRIHAQKEPTVRAVPLGDCSQLSSIITPAKSTQHGAAAPATLSNCLTFCFPSPHASRPSSPEINDCSILWNRARIVSTGTAAKNRGQCRDNRRRIDARPNERQKGPTTKFAGVKGEDGTGRGRAEKWRLLQWRTKQKLSEIEKTTAAWGIKVRRASSIAFAHIRWRLFALCTHVCGLLNKVTRDAHASLPFARLYKESARREMTYFRYSYTFSIEHKKLFDVLLYEVSWVFLIYWLQSAENSR